jgi:hypothetical protein
MQDVDMKRNPHVVGRSMHAPKIPIHQACEEVQTQQYIEPMHPTGQRSLYDRRLAGQCSYLDSGYYSGASAIAASNDPASESSSRLQH